MGGIGATELMLIFLVVLLVFGAKRIPEIAKGLGKGIREFKSATREITQELNVDDVNRIDPPRRPANQTMPRGSQSGSQTNEESTSTPSSES